MTNLAGLRTLPAPPPLCNSPPPTSCFTFRIPKLVLRLVMLMPHGNPFHSRDSLRALPTPTPVPPLRPLLQLGQVRTLGSSHPRPHPRRVPVQAPLRQPQRLAVAQRRISLLVGRYVDSQHSSHCSRYDVAPFRRRAISSFRPANISSITIFCYIMLHCAGSLISPIWTIFTLIDTYGPTLLLLIESRSVQQRTRDEWSL